MLVHVRKMHVCIDTFDVTLLIVKQKLVIHCKKSIAHSPKAHHCLFCQYYHFNESLLCAKVLV